MSDVIELGEVPERFERWPAGRPLATTSMSGWNSAEEMTLTR